MNHGIAVGLNKHNCEGKFMECFIFFRHVEELGVYDIFSALKSLPQCDFLTGENMGVARDDRLNTVVKQERGGGR